MEVLEITPDWGVVLDTPACELRLDGCNGPSCTHGVRVHGCAFHFACEACARKFTRRVHYGFRAFRNMRCLQCHAKFTNNKKYYQIVKL